MTSDMRARLAGADDERCGAPDHDRRSGLTCGARKHDSDQAHIAYSIGGVPVLQWNELTDDGKPEPRE
jgi:hypothetical protein